MLERARIPVIAAGGLVFLMISAAQAQTFGRVEFKVVTPEGEPVKDVQVTVTCQELTRFNKVKRTDKRGVVVVSFADATKVYSFLFEHPGYSPARRSLKPLLGQTVNQELILSKAGAAEGTAPAGTIEGSTFTPAETAFNEGVQAIGIGDDAQALERFRLALELDNDLLPVHSALARVHLSLENYEQAIAEANKFAELAGPDMTTYRVLYEAHTALGNASEAETAREALLGSGTPEETAALLYNEGVAALKASDDRGAEARFVEALELNPALDSALKGLALLYVRQKEWQDAAQTAERYLLEKPDDADVLRVRWEAYRGLGDSEREKLALEALTAADPRPLAAEFYKQGQSLLDRGRMEEGAAVFERVLELLPTHARAHYQLGLCLVNMGQIASARTHLETFVEMAPEDPEAVSAKEMLSFLK